MGRSVRRTFTFSSRTASASHELGGSIATSVEDLERVVLHDVARDADLLVEVAAPLDADLLGHGDLHVVDVLARPERLEDGVAEAEHQEVLDRLFPEVVVDPVDLALGEVRARARGSARVALARSSPKGFSTTTCW